MKNTPIIFLFLILITKLNAQVDNSERQQINQYTQNVNLLILHINTNIIALRNYQEKLNEWAENQNAGVTNVPIFKFKPFSQQAVFEKINASNSNMTYGNEFNYKAAAHKLYIQSLLFNQYCMQLEKNNATETKQSFYTKKTANLKLLENISNDWVDLCYSFSLSASINFGKEILPYQIDLLKSIVGQSKNIIMAMRDNNSTQLKSYLQKFNALVEDLTKIPVSEIMKAGKFGISEDVFKSNIQNLINQSYEIGAWAEQYLQTSLSKNEIEPVIFETIKAFNNLNNQKGTAATYNNLSAYSEIQILRFTQEPLAFKQKTSNSVREQITSAKIIEKEIAKPIETDSVKIATPKKVEFDKNDIQTLEGSLPSNIVFLMDISPSMKKDNKLSTLQSSILHYANLMRPDDRISLIAFSGKAKILLRGGTRYELDEIRKIVNSLFSTGGTDIENGFIYAYEVAKSTYMNKGNNRVILATDGEFGMRNQVLNFIEEKAEKEKIYLSIFHFSATNIPTEKKRLENMVKLGKGNYQNITTGQQAIKALISEIKIKATE